MKRDARWLLLPAIARAVATEVERIAGAAGRIELSGGSAPDVVCRLLAAHGGEIATIRRHVANLLAGGHLKVDGGALVFPRSQGAIRTARWRALDEASRQASPRRHRDACGNGEQSVTETSREPVTETAPRDIIDPVLSGSSLRSPSAPLPLKADLKTASPDTTRAVSTTEAKAITKRSACPTSEAGPDELGAWCAQWKLPPADPELAGFLDHHRAKRSLFADWAAAWRTWQRNGVRFGRGPGASPRSTLQQAPATGRTWKLGEEV